MTRAWVYGGGLATFVVATALTLTAIIIPRWVSFRDSTDGLPVTYTYGLHQRCSTVTGLCEHYPTSDDCHGPDRYFCSMWRSIGFLMSFAIVLEGMVILAFITILTGGAMKRRHGWKVVSFLLLLGALVQCAAMALVAFLYDNDIRFANWNLDVSWILTTISWSLIFLIATTLVGTAYYLPPEGDYELIK